MTHSDQLRARIRKGVTEQLDTLAGRRSVETIRATQALAQVVAQEKKLLAAHLADQVSPDLFDEQQRRLRRERLAHEQRLEHLALQAKDTEDGLTQSLALGDRAQQAYCRAKAQVRRLFNQAHFERIEIDNERVHRATLKAPFSAYVQPPDGTDSPTRGRTAPGAVLGRMNGENGRETQTGAPFFGDAGSNFASMVETAGVEPASATAPRAMSTSVVGVSGSRAPSVPSTHVRSASPPEVSPARRGRPRKVIRLR